MAGIKEIAAATGLSMNTVSRALRQHGYVSASAAARVAEAAARLNYHPNQAARELRSSVSHTIAVVAESGDALHIAKITAIQEEAARHQYSVNNYFAGKLPGSDIASLLQTIRCARPAGIIFIGIAPEIVDAARRIQKEFPTAVISYSAASDLNCVYIDRRQGVRDAIYHMYKHGRRRIAYMGSDQLGNKLKGYYQAIAELGLEPLIIPADDMAQKDSARKNAREAVKIIQAMAVPPDGIQCSDYHAAGLIAELPAAGFKVPQDIAVSGFDDRDFTTIISPALTTVAQPNRETGTEAAKLLLAEIASPGSSKKNILVPMTLKIRESTLWNN